MMKVLHLISGGDIGGAKTHVLTLLKALNDKENIASLLCVMEGTFTDDAKKLGIPITIIPQRFRMDIPRILEMAEFIKNEKFDLLHCHGARANFLALFFRIIVNLPMITTIHSDYRLDFKGSKYKQLFFMPLNAFALRRFNHLFAVTSVFKEMLILRGFDSTKINVVYNGVDFDRKLTFVPPIEFLRRYNIQYDPGNIYIGVASRLHPVKGVNVLLDAAKEIIPKYKNVEFVIAGSGVEYDKYMNFIVNNNLSGKVHLLGHVDDMDSFYNLIHINTLTSYSESFPYSLLEGAMHKKPTIASAVGGIVEMINHNNTGFLFESGNTALLVKYLSKFIDDKYLRVKFGNAFYEYSMCNFSVRKMAAAHLDIYKAMLKK